MGRKKIIKVVIAERLPPSDIQPEPQIEPINEPIKKKKNETNNGKRKKKEKQMQ